MPSRARVAWQDVPFAKGAIWQVCGPIAPLTPELAARTLNNMAGHGPGTRVGLIPQAGTRRWKFDDRPGDTAVDADFTFDSDDINEMLAQMMTTSPNVPIWIAPRGGGGEYVCMYVDHGVGDAHLIIELFVAMTLAAQHADFVPPIPGSMRTPLLSCFWNAAKEDPKGLWSEAKALGKTFIARRRSRSDGQPQEPAGESQAIQSQPMRAESELPTAVFVKSQVGYADELRAYRERTGQTVSVSTLIMRSLYHAFRDAGVNLSDDLLVLTDMRRFLPEGRWSLANLSGAVSVAVTPEMTAEEFTAAVFWQVTSRKPLLRLMGTAVAARLKGLPAMVDLAQSQSPPPTDEPLKMSVSDVSKIPACKKGVLKPGYDKKDVHLAIAVASPDPTYISICMLNPPHDGAVHLTASFYASRIDPEIVRKALAQALVTPGSPQAE
jgi:hypothetical protein